MNILFDQRKIEDLIPHRGKSLFIDKAYINQLFPMQVFVVRLITPETHELEGHLPDDPIYPGFRYLEIANLGAAILVKHNFPETKGRPGIISQDGVKYRNKGLIGDKILASVKLVKAIPRQGPKHFTFSAIIRNQKGELLCEIKKFCGMAI